MREAKNQCAPCNLWEIITVSTQEFSSVKVFPVRGFSEAKLLCFSAQIRRQRPKKARFLLKNGFKFQGAGLRFQVSGFQRGFMFQRSKALVSGFKRVSGSRVPVSDFKYQVPQLGTHLSQLPGTIQYSLFSIHPLALFINH